MLDVRLFKRPAFGVSSLSLGLVFFASMVCSLACHCICNLSRGIRLASSVRLLPVAGALTISSPLSTTLAKRFGKRRLVAAGMAMVSIGTLYVSTVGISSSYLHLVVGMVILAFGMGLAMSPTNRSTYVGGT